MWNTTADKLGHIEIKATLLTQLTHRLMKSNDTQNSLKLFSLGVLLSATITLSLITVLNAAIGPQEPEKSLNVNEIKFSDFYCGNE